MAVNVVTQGIDQLHQVVWPAALQCLQRLNHLQTVSNASTDRTIHAAKHCPRSYSQTVSDIYLQHQPHFGSLFTVLLGWWYKTTRTRVVKTFLSVRTSRWASSLALFRSLYRAACPNLTSSTRAESDSAPFFEIIEPEMTTTSNSFQTGELVPREPFQYQRSAANCPRYWWYLAEHRGPDLQEPVIQSAPQCSSPQKSGSPESAQSEHF